MVIHDRSYRRWDGNRDTAVKAIPVITSAGIQQGLSAFFRRKVPAVIMTLLSFALFLFGLVFIFFRHYVMSNAATMNADVVEFVSKPELVQMTTASSLTMYWYLVIQAVFALIVCVIMGTGLIANDRRTNALELYLSSPVSVSQYFLGKLGAVTFFVALVTLIPATLLVLAQLVVSLENPSEVTRLLDVLWRTVAAGCVMVFVPSMLVLAASSMAQRARNAGIMLLGLIVLLDLVLASMLMGIFGDPQVLLLSILFNVNQSVAWVLGEESTMVPEVPAWQSLAVLGGWCLLSLRIVLKRVRPVEIVG